MDDFEDTLRRALPDDRPTNGEVIINARGFLELFIRSCLILREALSHILNVKMEENVNSRMHRIQEMFLSTRRRSDMHDSNQLLEQFDEKIESLSSSMNARFDQMAELMLRTENNIGGLISQINTTRLKGEMSELAHSQVELLREIGNLKGEIKEVNDTVQSAKSSCEQINSPVLELIHTESENTAAAIELVRAESKGTAAIIHEAILSASMNSELKSTLEAINQAILSAPMVLEPIHEAIQGMSMNTESNKTLEAILQAIQRESINTESNKTLEGISQSIQNLSKNIEVNHSESDNTASIVDLSRIELNKTTTLADLICIESNKTVEAIYQAIHSASKNTEELIKAFAEGIQYSTSEDMETIRHEIVRSRNVVPQQLDEGIDRLVAAFTNRSAERTSSSPVPSSDRMSPAPLLNPNHAESKNPEAALYRAEPKLEAGDEATRSSIADAAVALMSDSLESWQVKQMGKLVSTLQIKLQKEKEHLQKEEHEARTRRKSITDCLCCRRKDAGALSGGPQNASSVQPVEQITETCLDELSSEVLITLMKRAVLDRRG